MLLVFRFAEYSRDAREQIRDVREICRTDEQLVRGRAEAHPVAVPPAEAETTALVGFQVSHVAAHGVVDSLQDTGVTGPFLQLPGQDHKRFTPGRVSGAGPTGGRR